MSDSSAVRYGAVAPIPASPAEWVGGRFATPIVRNDQAGQPLDLVVWYEPESALVVALDLCSLKEGPEAVVRILERGMALPAAGPARQPGVLRVADDQLGTHLKSALGGRFEVRLAASPELEQIVKRAVESISDEEPSYFEGGTVGEESIRAFFEATAHLDRLDPLDKVFDERHVFEFSAPSLGIDRGCVTIAGGPRGGKGVILFESLTDFDNIPEDDEPEPEEGESEPARPFRHPLTLAYQRKRDIPPELVKEIRRHGWTITDASSIPVLFRGLGEASAPPITERDYLVATVLAESLAQFFERHADVENEVADGGRIVEEFVVPSTAGERHCRLSAPHPERDWSEEAEGEDDRDDDGDGTLDPLFEDFPDPVGAQLLSRFIDDLREAAPDKDQSAASLMATFAGGLLMAKIVRDRRIDGPWVASTIDDAFEKQITEIPFPVQILPLVPEAFEIFIHWLGDEEWIEPSEESTLTKRVAKKKKEFLRRAADPANWTAEKVALMEEIERDIER